jgi:cell division protein FtsA
VIPIAGDQVTNDIAMSMRTPTQYAEDIKIKLRLRAVAAGQPRRDHRGAERGRARPPRRLARQTLAEVVEPRYEELFGLVRDELRRSGFEDMIAAGIVLTGGSAKMEGAIELAEEVFHMPVRLGVPQHGAGLGRRRANPILFDGVGAAAPCGGATRSTRSRAADIRRKVCAGILVIEDEELVPGQFLIFC